MTYMERSGGEKGIQHTENTNRMDKDNDHDKKLSTYRTKGKV
jgi:hypothetical protein